MRILYDHQTFMYQSIGGISQYFTQLMNHLPPGVSPLLALDNTKNENAVDLERFATKPFRTTGRRSRIQRFIDKARGYDLRKLNTENSIIAIQDIEYDIFHPTAYDPYCLASSIKAPLVISFYDCIHERLPEHFSPSDNMTASKRLYLKHADAVICISHYTKTEMFKYLEFDENRTHVVHLGVDCELFKNAQEEGLAYAKMFGRYVLFVGGRSGYKNWVYWLRALERPMKRHSDINIVCTGRQFSTEEKALIESLGLEGRVYQCSVSSKQLPGLYGGAAGFFFPSLDEGFGLPTLEALASGCPAALSDIPVMREIAGDSAVYFGPKDAKSIESAFELFACDDRILQELSCKGKERAATFSWERTARETAAVYEKTLGR
jgi:glycosyltransferase involved in cell wall biosynthesis